MDFRHCAANLALTAALGLGLEVRYGAARVAAVWLAAAVGGGLLSAAVESPCRVVGALACVRWSVHERAWSLLSRAPIAAPLSPSIHLHTLQLYALSAVIVVRAYSHTCFVSWLPPLRVPQVVGASGGAFGLLGLFAADTALHWRRLRRPMLRCALVGVLLGLLVFALAAQQVGTGRACV